MHSSLLRRSTLLGAALTLSLSTSALAIANSPLSGSATVDGDAANAELTPTERHIDQAALRTERGWIKSFTTTWDAGVKFTVPPSKATKIGTIETVVSGDTSANGKHDLGEPGEQGDPVVTDLWISAKHGKSALTLKSKLGVKTLKATLTGGGKPRLSVTGLPAGTFRVTFATSGSVGTKILSLKDGCGDSAAPMSATTSARLADGKTRRFTTTDTSVICDGQAKPAN